MLSKIFVRYFTPPLFCTCIVVRYFGENSKWSVFLFIYKYTKCRCIITHLCFVLLALVIGLDNIDPSNENTFSFWGTTRTCIWRKGHGLKNQTHICAFLSCSSTFSPLCSSLKGFCSCSCGGGFISWSFLNLFISSSFLD